MYEIMPSYDANCTSNVSCIISEFKLNSKFSTKSLKYSNTIFKSEKCSSLMCCIFMVAPSTLNVTT